MSIEATLIAPAQLQTLMSSEPVVLIDTRDADTFAAGHIPGAVNLREVFTFLATSTPEGLMELKATFADALGKAGLSGAETAVFYEDAMNSGYGQSCRGYYLLTWLGYPKIKVLNGGFSAWKASGLPVSTEAATESFDAVVVTAGAQNAFALLLRALCRPGDAVVIDHPSFHHAIDAITRAQEGHQGVPLGMAEIAGQPVEIKFSTRSLID